MRRFLGFAWNDAGMEDMRINDITGMIQIVFVDIFTVKW